MAKETKKLTLEETLKALDKQYGKGSVINGGEAENYTEVVSTGSLSLDLALGIGGLPFGKMVELIGWESSGKSTITQTIIGECQKMGKRCVLVDGENSLDEKYAKALGVDLDKLLLIQLDEHGGEGAYNKAEQLIETGEIDVVVIDSQNSLQPKKVLDSDAGDSNIGVHARLMNQVVPKFTNLASRHNCLVIFVSQLREKIGVMFGSPETTQGGNALRFYAHVRIDIRKTPKKEGDDYYANETRVKVIKNKMAPPFKTATFEILYGKGINREKELIEISEELGIIQKSGSWYSYGEHKIGQGSDSVRLFLQDNPEFAADIKKQVLEILNKK